MAEHCSESTEASGSDLANDHRLCSRQALHVVLFFINFLWKAWKCLNQERLNFVFLLWESSILRTLVGIPLILVLILKNTESEAAHFRKPPVFPWGGRRHRLPWDPSSASFSSLSFMPKDLWAFWFPRAGKVLSLFPRTWGGWAAMLQGPWLVVPPARLQVAWQERDGEERHLFYWLGFSSPE